MRFAHRATFSRCVRPASFRWGRRAVLSGVLTAVPAVAESTATAMLASGCTGCHGSDGGSVGAAIPSIAGLDKIYLARVMVQFKNGERPSTIMGRIASGYEDSELRTMAKHFGSLPWSAWRTPSDETAIDMGRQIHDRICAECHEREGQHQDRDTPRIAGQAPEYLFTSLLQYRDPQSDMKLPQPSKMLDALKPLTDEQLLALSHYYASRP